MKNSKGFIQIVVILLALVIVAGGAYYFGTLKNKVASVVPTSSPIASIQPSPNPTAKTTDVSTIKSACIALEGSSKSWNDTYKECQDSSGNPTLVQKLQVLCTKYQGTFDANSSSCRHTQQGEPCGPEPAVVCSF